MSETQEGKKKQVLICASLEQLERATRLFPKLEVRAANGDWTPYIERKLVCLGYDLAQVASAFADPGNVKWLPAEIPDEILTPEAAWAWATAPGNAQVYTPNVAPQDAAPVVPPTAQAAAAPNGGKVEAVAEFPPATALAPAEAASDQEKALDAPETTQAEDDAIPPWHGYDALESAETALASVSRGWEPPVHADMGLPADLWAHDDALPAIAPECYPDALAAYIADEAEAMGCDAGMLALYCTAICAGAVTDEIRLQVKSASDRWQESARVWLMVVGDSGLTMKSPTLDAAISHAWRIERELRVNGGQALKDHATELQIYEAQKAEYVKKRAKGEPADMPEEPALPVSERLIVGNATIEAIGDVLLQQGERGVLVRADELLGIVAGMNQYKAGGKGSDRQDWLEFWNGGHHAIDRKGRAVLVKNWGASIVGGTQPEAIARVGVGLEADGLLQRFSIYLPRYAVKGPDVATDAEARKRYHAALDRLVKLAPRPDLAPVRFSPEAAQIVDQARDWIFHTARASWLPAGLRSHLAKWPAMLVRYCLTYAAIEAADEAQPCIPAAISEHIAAQVWRMMQGALWPHAKHFYLTTLSGAGDKAALRQIAGLILSEGWKEITTRQMMQRSSIFRIAKPPEQRAIVSALCELGWIDPAGGKSLVTGIPTKYRVNMVAHERFSEIADRERAERGERTARWGETRAAKRESSQD